MALREISQDEIAEMQLYIVELEEQRRCDEAKLQKLSIALEETRNHKAETVSSFSSTGNQHPLRSCADNSNDGTVATATMMIQRMKSTHQHEILRLETQMRQEKQKHRDARAVEAAQREEETRKLLSQTREQKESIEQLERRLNEKDDKLGQLDKELQKERESLKESHLLNASLQREIEDLKSQANSRNDAAYINGEKIKNEKLAIQECEFPDERRRKEEEEGELQRREQMFHRDTKVCLQELETMLHQKTEQIAKCEEELATLNLTLKANLSAMQQMEKVIEIKECRISKYVRELKEKDGVTAALRTQLSKEKKRLEEQLELVDQRDNEIARLRKAQKEEAAAAADSRAAKDNDRMTKERMDKLIADLENQVRAKHDELRDRSRDIKEYQNTIRRLEAKLTAEKTTENRSRDIATSPQSSFGGSSSSSSSSDALEQQVSTLKNKVSKLETSLTLRENSLKAMRLDKAHLRKLFESAERNLKQASAKLSVDMPQLEATILKLQENLAMKSSELEALQIQKHRMQQGDVQMVHQAPKQRQAPEPNKVVSENEMKTKTRSKSTSRKNKNKNKNRDRNKTVLPRHQDDRLAVSQGDLLVENDPEACQVSDLKQTLQSQLLQITKKRETAEEHDAQKSLGNTGNDDLSHSGKVSVLHIENRQLLDAISKRDKELANLKLKATEAEKVYSKSLSGMEALCSERDELLESYESCKEESRALQDRIGELEAKMAEMSWSPSRSPPSDSNYSSPAHQQKAAKKGHRGTRSLSPTASKATAAPSSSSTFSSPPPSSPSITLSSPSSAFSSLSSPGSYGRAWRPLPRPRMS